MKSLLSSWNKVKKSLCGKNLFIFLDYDGTLTPIVDTPDMAVLPRETKALLLKLSKVPLFTLAIISGRSLQDIKRKVRLPKIIYAGNHGLELEGPGLRSLCPVPPSYNVILKKLKDKLKTRLSCIPGVIIEDKGLTLSIHYRMAPKNSQKAIWQIVTDEIRSCSAQKVAGINLGKKIIEIKPIKGSDKGKIASWLLARQYFLLNEQPVLSVYIGDDVTDEDAFNALRDKGMTVFVGRSSTSAAQYYLKDTKEVLKFLYMLSSLNHKRNTANER